MKSFMEFLLSTIPEEKFACISLTHFLTPNRNELIKYSLGENLISGGMHAICLAYEINHKLVKHSRGFDESHGSP